MAIKSIHLRYDEDTFYELERAKADLTWEQFMLTLIRTKKEVRE